MSDLLNIATIILVGIIQASMQLSIGGLILLYHHSMGKHRRTRTKCLASCYIWGNIIFTLIAAMASCYFVQQLLLLISRDVLFMILIGALFASALVTWGMYYRNNKTTELWIPRSFSRYINRRARNTNDGVEAFALGILNSFAEAPLSIALFLVAGHSINSLNQDYQIIAILGYALLCAIPLVALRLKIKTGHAAVGAQKDRLKNRSFNRGFLGSSFAVLALFLIAFWVA